MKKILAIIFVLFCFNLKAQTTASKNNLVDVESLIDTTSSNALSTEQGKVIYNAEACYLITYHNGNKVITKPQGNKVEIDRDLFFKSYKISFYDENGERQQINLSLLKDYGNGLYSMVDHFNNVVLVTDNLNDKGILNISHTDESNNVDCVVKITGASKK